MDASVGKRKRVNNESNRERQNCGLHRDKELYDLPLEILDIILQKSYLHWILNLSTKQRDEGVIRSLISVDVCFNQRITRQRFKRTIWRNLKDFYAKTKKRTAIIRNNGNYLLENIQPSDELIASLLSLNCITEEQSQLIQIQRSNRHKSAELLHVIKSFDEKNVSNLVMYLRESNQNTVARIIENGGVVIKVKVKSCGTTCPASMDQKLLHRGISDFRNRTKPISHRTNKLISQLKEEGIEILSSHLNRQTVVVWIWCRSQEALKHIQQLYESNQLRDVFLGFANILPPAFKIIKWLTIDYLPHAMSVSSDGNLLMVDESSFDLLIYGSDAELLQSVKLQEDFLYPHHVVETTTGNFIISHGWTAEEEDGEGGSSVGQLKTTWTVSEATRDGQMVIRRFIPSNELQKLNDSKYLSLDSDDQVFVADFFNGRVILLDSDLKWNRILCPTKELEETKNQLPQRLYFDFKKKQLLVGDFSATRQGVNVYTFS